MPAGENDLQAIATELAVINSKVDSIDEKVTTLSKAVYTGNGHSLLTRVAVLEEKEAAEETSQGRRAALWAGIVAAVVSSGIGLIVALVVS